MNDRFKFRVWDKERKCFFNNDEVVIYPNGEESFFNADYDFTECVVEQCTGLKDKNGKLIYEGDILSLYKLKNPIVVICKWNIDKWVFVDTSGCIRNDYHMEVIGNIHENQELLEQSNE